MAYPVLILTLIHLWPLLPVYLSSLLIRIPVILINTHPAASSRPVVLVKTSFPSRKYVLRGHSKPPINNSPYNWSIFLWMLQLTEKQGKANLVQSRRLSPVLVFKFHSSPEGMIQINSFPPSVSSEGRSWVEYRRQGWVNCPSPLQLLLWDTCSCYLQKSHWSHAWLSLAPVYWCYLLESSNTSISWRLEIPS